MTIRIASGVTDQYVYFVAVDATDFASRETGLTTFTVYRSRNGAAAAVMTTPTINETDATNMPGVYELLLDEDMTIGTGNDTEAMVFHITHAGMAPVTLEIELYRPKITAGNTLDVTATGAAGIDWGNVENPTTTVDLSATSINLCDTVTTNTDMRGTDSAYTGTPPTAGAIADSVWDELQSAHTTAGSFGEIATEIASILADTNELQTDDVPGLIAALNNISAADVNAQVLDVLNTDTFAEPSGVPAATTTLATKIGYLYMALRNRVDVTSTKKTFYDDGGAAEWEKDLSDDGTTYSESEGNAI